jgi:hypothetical protein
MKSLKLMTLLITVVIAACTIRPPDNADDLGPEASQADINKAFADAQAGVNIETAYRTGDNGKSQMIYKVISDTFVSETHLYQVTEVNAQHILYQDDYTLHARSADEIDKHGQLLFEIVKQQPSPSPSPSPSPFHVGGKVSFLPNSFSKAFSTFYAGAKKLFSSISFEFSTAIGQTQSSAPAHFISLQDLESHKLIEADLQTRLYGGPLHSNSTAVAPSARESHYYGLRAYKHRFLTNNCSQLADCSVNATHIQFNEMTTGSDNQPTKIHWIYEVSIEVPGIFIVMEECYSTLAKQGDGSQIPLTVCNHVDNFKFGFAPKE